MMNGSDMSGYGWMGGGYGGIWVPVLVVVVVIGLAFWILKQRGK